ncbi:hypothetical protein A0J61_01874 [Choanephora cucurbitarum]|uniref:Uncharacterized protein n=1 Tax=Choanephora cucurbitarum TaxID=101091 RepID=A0A1C7NNP0_9FUNG|nr:hypothetical protein A0J61_01874 [Choanephora cucurbitarum]
MTDGKNTSYKDIIKQLAAQAPEPYGAIPPREKQKKNKKKKRPTLDHMENWIAVDSKESLPDEQDLIQSSSNFLSTNFLVLPLHMPPPSLSKQETLLIPRSPSISLLNEEEEEEEEEEDDDDEDEDEEEEEEEEEESHYISNKQLTKKISIPSFSSSKSHQPSTSMTASCAMSPPPAEEYTSRWKETIAQLRRSLTLNKKITPMPPPPTIPKTKKRRRSEATTQPRFNPETNTYTRDTRSNPDHLRMISAELNMMRHRKLSGPLKPRGFLPRRTDVFVRGQNRKTSLLRFELVDNKT